ISRPLAWHFACPSSRASAICAASRRGGAMRTLRCSPIAASRVALAAVSLFAVATFADRGRAATLAVANNRFAVRADSTRTWTEDDPPTSLDTISWWTGPNLADDKRYLRIFEGNETKFRFSFSGSLLTPPGKDFGGFAP